jgi:hypothetical protein
MRERCALALSAQKCTWRGEICQVAKICQVGCQTIGAQFFLFCQKYMDAKLIWQTLGDACGKKIMTERYLYDLARTSQLTGPHYFL